MKQTTVCFLVRYTPEMQVLLGQKKMGFGTGKYAGIGGKLETGETIEEAAVREVEEEIGVKISVSNMQFMGTTTFIFPFRVDWNQEVSVFLADDWQGEPAESSEMKPCWFRTADIPYDSMWQDAHHWLPLILTGTKLHARISFKDDNETVDEVTCNPFSSTKADK